MSLMPVRSLSEIAADIEREWMPNIAGMAQPCVRAARARTAPSLRPALGFYSLSQPFVCWSWEVSGVPEVCRDGRSSKSEAEEGRQEWPLSRGSADHSNVSPALRWSRVSVIEAMAGAGFRCKQGRKAHSECWCRRNNLSTLRIVWLQSLIPHGL
jgi:hypothetical protein